MEVLKSVLKTNPDTSVVDGKMRTPLHVAAYQGKHEVFSHLVSLCTETEGALLGGRGLQMMQMEDDTGRTAFEIMAE